MENVRQILNQNSGAHLLLFLNCLQQCIQALHHCPHGRSSCGVTARGFVCHSLDIQKAHFAHHMQHAAFELHSGGGIHGSHHRVGSLLIRKQLLDGIPNRIVSLPEFHLFLFLQYKICKPIGDPFSFHGLLIN